MDHEQRQLRQTVRQRLERWLLLLIESAISPLLLRERAAVANHVDEQLRRTTATLHAAVDAGVIALAARASVLDAAVASVATDTASLTNIALLIDSTVARLDRLAADGASLAARMHAAHLRLDIQQRLIFDGMLDELAVVQQDWHRHAADQRDAMTALRIDVAPMQAALNRVDQYSYTSARRAAVGCAEDVLVRSEAGYILCSGSDLSVLATLIETGELERGTRRLIEALLQPGDCFIDVGANIGMHTLAAGRAMQRRGTIHAFEPFEATRLLLQKSVWLNGLTTITTIHANAVSDHAGAEPLYLGASSGHHSLFGSDAGGGAQVTVLTVRLDDVVKHPVNLVKIDAEGAELDVLAGAHALVANNHDLAMIVECGPAHLVRNGHTVDAWLAAFAALGLRWRAIDPLTGTLSDTTPAMLATAESTNLLFARPGAPCWTNVLEQK